MSAPHMTPEEFRALGHRFVDWAADHMAGLESHPVRPPTKPGELLAQLPDVPPESPGGPDEWDSILNDLDRLIVPNLMLWQHPKFFGYFPCNGSGPGVLGELVSAALNVNGMLWSTSPAVTELEIRVLDWFADLFGLPDGYRSGETHQGPDGVRRGGGVIQGTASEATLIALLAARARAGVADPSDLWVFASDQAHSSVAKAAMIAGVARGPDDTRRLRIVPCDDAQRLDPRALVEGIMDAVGGHGHAPKNVAVTFTLGTTGTTAVDPMGDAIAALNDAWRERWGQPFGGWIHADAAFNGCAWVCDEHRWMMRGLEAADSVCVNPHKWLLTNFDCDLFWTRDTDAVRNALSVTPEYLRNQASDTGSVVDYRDWQIPLGRRFRALKLWFVARHYGRSGLQAHIRQHVADAERFEASVRDDPRFEPIAERTTSLVCFRLRPAGDGEHPEDTDARNMRLMDAINASGDMFLSHTSVRLGTSARPSIVLRLAVGSTASEPRHVAEAWDIVRRHADLLVGSAP